MGRPLLPAITASPVAQFICETEAGNRATLHIEQGRSGRNVSLECAKYNGFSAFLWKDGPRAYLLRGQAERPQFLPPERAMQA